MADWLLAVGASFSSFGCVEQSPHLILLEISLILDKGWWRNGQEIEFLVQASLMRLGLEWNIQRLCTGWNKDWFSWVLLTRFSQLHHSMHMAHVKTGLQLWTKLKINWHLFPWQTARRQHIYTPCSIYHALGKLLHCVHYNTSSKSTYLLKTQ